MTVVLVVADDISGVLTKRNGFVTDSKFNAASGKAAEVPDSKRVAFDYSDAEFVLQENLLVFDESCFYNRVKLFAVCGDVEVAVSSF